MAKVDNGFLELGYMDTLSRQDTAIHRLDPRIKLMTTMMFVTVVVSFGKYELSALFPFFFYPVFLCSAGNISLLYLLKKILLVSPFAIMIGIFNPLLDSQVHYVIGDIRITGGWISFISILLRFVLTVGAALSLIAVTGFNSICIALEKFRIPRVFTVQLMFLYRYLFLLTAEATRMVRAVNLRKPPGKSLGINIFGSLLGHLLLRTLDRAQRIHLAMQCRGFDGHIRTIKRTRIGIPDAVFFLIWSTLFVIMRCFNLPQELGALVTGFLV
ncbi:MAG: cobalt ECF transporter T component CbiQ [SAR324 cluster bacterium]|nr:cobalt ECF transporter T component CbiQ [SAR324 cluster bacterium]